MSPDEARRVARLRLGNAPLIREDARAVWGWRWMDAAAQDVRYAFRVMRNAPAFAAVMILTMGLGVGAVTAVYTIVDSILFRPLPFQDPSSLYTVVAGFKDGYRGYLTRDEVRELRDKPGLFTSVEAYRNDSWTLEEPEPAVVEGTWVTPDLFDSLGVPPSLGRSFDRDEAADVALISTRLWRARFAGRKDVLGQVLRLQHGSFSVVGVLDDDVRFPDPGIDVWLPMDLRQADDADVFHAVARLREDLSFDLGNERLRAVSAQLLARPETRFELRSLHWAGPGRADSTQRRAPLLLLGAVALTLLLTCANVATLSATRALVRRREFAVRRAVGAGRSRLARQMFIESSTWAVCGGMVAILVAIWAIDLISSFVPPYLLNYSPIRPDARMLAFALLSAAATGIAAGVLPASFASRQHLLTARTPGARPGHGLPRSVLLLVQVSLASVLTVAAGLMINSYLRLTSVPIGASMDGLIAAEPVTPESRYVDPQQRRLVVEQWAETAAADPRVTEASITTVFPLRFHRLYRDALVSEDGGPQEVEDYVSVGWVAPNYFGVLGIPLIRGRTFGAQTSDPRSVVIGQRIATQLWGGSSAVGRRFRLGQGSDRPWGNWMTVVGVVGDVREIGYHDLFNPLEIYFPISNESDLGIVYVIARGQEDAAVVKALEQHWWALVPDVPLRFYRGDQILWESADDPRFRTLVLAGFSGLALALAACAIYGVVSRTVRDRTQEIGVRLALGARPSHIMRLVLRREFMLTIGGLAGGLGAAWLVSETMRSVLFELEPTDPMTFATVAAVFAAAAGVACAMPARRATSVDPATALRAE